MKIGVRLPIAVKKLDKSKFFTNDKGELYATVEVFIDTEPDQYGKNGGIYEMQTKEERESKAKRNYVGNCKVFWMGDSEAQEERKAIQSEPAKQYAGEFMDDDIPFANPYKRMEYLI